MENWGADWICFGSRRKTRATVALLAVLGLVACKGSGPADQALVTGGTEAEYRASLDPLIPKMSKHELEAFDWAVQDFDLAKLQSRYPGASPRKIIRGEVNDVLDTYPGMIKTLEKKAAEEGPLRDELISGITAKDVEFSIEKNFFGLQPIIKATVTNASRYSISQLKWQAELYLDDAKTPVAQAVIPNDYRENGGMKMGDQFKVRFSVGYLRGNESWTTLEIRNAAKRRVTLEPLMDTILDFGDRPYLPDDPVSGIERKKAAIEAAKRYSDI